MLTERRASQDHVDLQELRGRQVSPDQEVRREPPETRVPLENRATQDLSEQLETPDQMELVEAQAMRDQQVSTVLPDQPDSEEISANQETKARKEPQERREMSV